MYSVLIIILCSVLIIISLHSFYLLVFGKKKKYQSNRNDTSDLSVPEIRSIQFQTADKEKKERGQE